MSCASHRWVDVTTEVNVENVMRDNFPQLYSDYKSNDIIVTKVEQRKDDGTLYYRVTHKNNTNDNAVDDMLWLTVFMPLLYQNKELQTCALPLPIVGGGDRLEQKWG